MKKSRSSVPRFADKFELGPAPPVKYDGLFPTAGLPDPELPPPPAPLFVAMAVGNTKEGASFPANPVIVSLICDLAFCFAYPISRIRYRYDCCQYM